MTPTKTVRAALLWTCMTAVTMVAPALADEDGETVGERLEALEGQLKQQQEALDLLLQEQKRLKAQAEEEARLRKRAEDDLAAQKAVPVPVGSVTAPASDPVPVSPDAPVVTTAGGRPTPPADLAHTAAEAMDEYEVEFGETKVTFGGFVKLDVIGSSFSDGELADNSLGRDFYIPSLIPVIGSPVDGGGLEEGDDIDLDFNPRETRFLARSETVFENGIKLTGLIELDFQVTSDGNELVSNSFVPRIRQGYLQIEGLTPGRWLFGQTWSTFQNVEALPENLDFIGPTEGTVFIRQPLIRYSYKGFDIALEQPETEITPFQGGGGSPVTPGDERLPDVAVRYTHRADWGHLKIAALGRELKAENFGSFATSSANAFGYGISASGKIKVGARDDFRFMVNAGQGIGRYIGVDLIDGVVDNGRGDLNTRGLISGFASYRHFWTDTLRSNLTAGYFVAEDDVELTGAGETRDVQSWHGNLIWSPVPKLDLGFEGIYASRTIENGASGELLRGQFSITYRL